MIKELTLKAPSLHQRPSFHSITNISNRGLNCTSRLKSRSTKQMKTTTCLLTLNSWLVFLTQLHRKIFRFSDGNRLRSLTPPPPHASWGNGARPEPENRNRGKLPWPSASQPHVRVSVVNVEPCGSVWRHVLNGSALQAARMIIGPVRSATKPGRGHFGCGSARSQRSRSSWRNFRCL